MVGAGVAGVPAAVAAARAGAQTVLVEQRPFPGGAGVAGLHSFICGLYLNSDPPSDQFLNPGLVAEICSLMGSNGPALKARRMGRVDVLPYQPAQFRDVLSGIIKSQHGLQGLFGTAVKGAVFDGQRVTSVLTEAGEWVPRVVVDCSGEGLIIQTAPVLHTIQPESDRQLAGCTVRFGGIIAPADELTLRVPYVLRRAKDAGQLPAGMQFAVFTMGSEPGEGGCKLSLPPAGLRHGCTVDEAAKRVHAILKESLAEFADSMIIDLSPEVLEREGARLRGQYTLTGDDIRESRQFPDGVVRNAWPMEIWDQTRGPTYRYQPAGEFYEIPLRCLKAAAADNLLCAGRCISVSSEALGSTRVMGTCLALGEAAGLEAARMVRAGSVR